MDIIKGATSPIYATVYSTWTGDPSTSTIQNLTGADINLYAKQRSGDPDSNAIFIKAGSVYDAVNGIALVTILASDTVNLSYPQLVFEIVVLVGATTIRNGVGILNLLPNVGKGLS